MWWCAVYDTWWHHSSGVAVPLCCVWYMVTPFKWCCGSAVLCMIHGDKIQLVLRFRCAVYDTWWHHSSGVAVPLCCVWYMVTPPQVVLLLCLLAPLCNPKTVVLFPLTSIGSHYMHKPCPWARNAIRGGAPNSVLLPPIHDVFAANSRCSDDNDPETVCFGPSRCKLQY